MMKHGASFEESSSFSKRYQPTPFGEDFGNRSRAQSMASTDEKDRDRDSKDGRLSQVIKRSTSRPEKPTFQTKRRNSTGTIYIDTTMSKQDNSHTIDCIGVVIRAHMVDAAKQNIPSRKEYDAFVDQSDDLYADAKDEKNKTKVIFFENDIFI